MLPREKLILPDGMTDADYIRFRQRQFAERPIDTRPVTTVSAEKRTRQIINGFDRIREQIREDRKLIIEGHPRPVRNGKGVIVGLAVSVRLYEKGIEVPIDPHRVFINPPLRTKEGDKLIQSPNAVLWSILWESVETNPASEGWIP